MQKGQISLDLILTMIIALIIIGSFSIIITDFKSNQETRLAKEQLDLIGQNTASLLNTAQVLDGKFVIETTISKIRFSDSNGNTVSSYPNLTIISDKNILNTSIMINGNLLDSNFRINKTGTKLDTNSLGLLGKIVITNE